MQNKGVDAIVGGVRRTPGNIKEDKEMWYQGERRTPTIISAMYCENNIVGEVFFTIEAMADSIEKVRGRGKAEALVGRPYDASILTARLSLNFS